jgi:hypothetical protein
MPIHRNRHPQRSPTTGYAILCTVRQLHCVLLGSLHGGDSPKGPVVAGNSVRSQGVDRQGRLLTSVRSPYSSVVEHSLRKRKVGGSIPPGGTIYILLIRCAIAPRAHACLIITCPTARCYSPRFVPLHFKVRQGGVLFRLP